MSKEQGPIQFAVDTLGTEKLWGVEETDAGTYVFQFDVSTLADGERLRFRKETENEAATPVYKDDIGWDFEIFGQQAGGIFQTLAFRNEGKFKLHITQTGGTIRTLPSALYKISA